MIGFADGSRTLTHEELYARVAQAASGLASLGVSQGSCVALLLRNDPVFVEASFATQMLGAFTTPLNWHLQAEECAYILADCGAGVLIAHADLLLRIHDCIPSGVDIIVVETPEPLARAFRIERPHTKAAPAAREWERWIGSFPPWDKPALPSIGAMVYTSGTTGRPKGVRRCQPTEDGVQKQKRHVASVFGIEEDMRSVVTGPLYHGSPNAHALQTVRRGGSLLIQPRFDPLDLLRLVETYRITNLHLVPTMFVRLLKLPRAERMRSDLSSLRFVSHAAAPCPPEVKAAMLEWWGPILYEFYGATETGGVTFCDSQEWLDHPGTVGKPLPGSDLVILGDQGEALPSGVAGEIYVRPDRIADFTYHNLPDARAEIDRDGRVSVGDVGYLDADGYLFLCDRKRDMVISGGVNIYPAEIEAALLAMPGVMDCAVFGVPDAEMGEALAAAVQPEAGTRLTGDDITAWLKTRIANYKIPRHWEFAAALPRDDTGKIFKQKLREPYWANQVRRI
ncbi:MAG: acyl-CoA synthetase [Pigmentiphaga sp.]